MSDKNQVAFVLGQKGRIRGPILEVGSRNLGGTAGNDFRPHFPGVPYVGVDMDTGKGVDVVADLTNPTHVQQLLSLGTFQTVICLSVLEHCAQPFLMAAVIDRMLAPGGLLFVSVPFVWKLHAFPSDYWRFTPAGVQALFPTFRVIPAASYCTSKDAHRWPLTTPSIGTPKVGTVATAYYPILINMLMEKP